MRYLFCVSDGIGVFPRQRQQRIEPKVAVQHQRFRKTAHGAGFRPRTVRDPLLRLRSRCQGFRY